MSLIPFQLLFASVFVAASPGDGNLQEIPHHCLEEYASPSGRFRLSVRSGLDRHEKRYGPADYFLTQEGESVWCDTLPYMLCPAAVFDDGTVVGTGTRRPKGPLYSYTFLHVVIIDPSGTVVLNEVTKTRRVSLHSPRTPDVRAMFIDFQNRRLWLDVLDRPDKHSIVRHRVLRVYDVASGRKLSETDPSQLCSDADHAHCKLAICTAKPVPGTELLLVHAMAYDEDRARDGVFAVINSQGDLVWQGELADDYAVSAGGRRYDSCGDFRGKPPVFGAGDAPGSFWIRSVHDDARIEFEVLRNQTAEEWFVQKLRD